MLFSNLALHILAAYTAAVAASPVLVPRQSEVSIFMCEDTRFRGNCMTDVIRTGSCFNVRQEFVDRISSIRNNDRGDTSCTWYRESDCRGDSNRNQDDADLGDGNGRFNDAIRSYECRRKR